MAGDSASVLATKIKAWLERNKDEYPGVADTIRAGATDEDLTELETAIGVAVPDELREVLQAFDGQDYNESIYEFPAAPWSQMLGCKGIADMYNTMPEIVQMCEEEFGAWSESGICRIEADHQVGKSGCPVIGLNPLWIPFAVAHNGEGGAPVVWMIDMDPAPGADHGRVIAFGGEGDALGIWAPSLKAMLQDVHQVMQRRSPDPVPAAAGAGAGSADAAGAGADAADMPPAAGAGGLGAGGARRHRKVLYDDGPRIWYQYNPDLY